MWGPSSAGNPVRVLPAPPRPGLGLWGRGAGWVAPNLDPGHRCAFSRDSLSPTLLVLTPPGDQLVPGVVPGGGEVAEKVASAKYGVSGCQWVGSGDLRSIQAPGHRAAARLPVIAQVLAVLAWPGRLPWQAGGMPVTAQSKGLPSSALLSRQAGGCLEGAPAVWRRCIVGWCEWGGAVRTVHCELFSRQGVLRKFSSLI